MQYDKIYTDENLNRFLEEQEDKSQRLKDKINHDLDPYNLTLYCSCGYPRIVLRDSNFNGFRIKRTIIEGSY